MYNTQSRYLVDSLIPVVKEPTIRKKKRKRKKPDRDKIAQLKKKYGKDFILQLLLMLINKKSEGTTKKKKDKGVKKMRRAGVRGKGRGGGGFQSAGDIKKQRDAAAKVARLAKAGELRPGETEEERKERVLKATLSEADPTTALILELSGAFNFRQSNYKGDKVSLAGQVAYMNQIAKGINEIRKKQGDASENQGELFLRKQKLEREALNTFGQFQGPTFDNIYDPQTPRGSSRKDIVEGRNLGKDVVKKFMEELLPDDEMENAIKAVNKLAEEGLLYSDDDSEVEEVRPRGYRGPTVPGDTGETIPVAKKPKETEEPLDFDSPDESGAGVGLRPSPRERTSQIRPQQPPPVGELSSSSSSSGPDSDLDRVATGVAEPPSFEIKLQEGKLTTQEVADHLDTIKDEEGLTEFFASIFTSYPKELRPDDLLFKKYYLNKPGVNQFGLPNREYMDEGGLKELYDLYLDVSGSRRRKPEPKRRFIQDVSQKRFGFADILEGAEARLLSLSKIPETDSDVSDVDLSGSSDSETTNKFLDRQLPPQPIVPYSPPLSNTTPPTSSDESSLGSEPYLGLLGPEGSDYQSSSAEDTTDLELSDTKPAPTRKELRNIQKKIDFAKIVEDLDLSTLPANLVVADEKKDIMERLNSSIDSGNNTSQRGRLQTQLDKLVKRLQKGKSNINFGIDNIEAGADLADKKNPRFSNTTKIQPNKDDEGNKILYEYIDTETDEVYKLVDFYPAAQDIMVLLSKNPSSTGLKRQLIELDKDFRYNLRDEISGETPGKPGYSNNDIDTLSGAEDIIGKKLPKHLKSSDDPRRLRDTSSVLSYGNKGITIQNEKGYLTFVPFTGVDKPPKDGGESSDVPTDLEPKEAFNLFTPEGDYIGPTGSDLEQPGNILPGYLLGSSSSSDGEFFGPGPETEEELRQRDIRRKKKKEKPVATIVANLVEPPVLPQGVVGDLLGIDRLPGPPVSNSRDRADEIIREEAKAKRLATRQIRQRAEERREQELQQRIIEDQKEQQEIDKSVGADKQAQSLLKYGVVFDKEDISSEEKGDENILAEKKLVGKQKKVNTKQLDEAKEKLKKNQAKKVKKGGKQTAKESKDEKSLTKKITDLEKRRVEQQKKLDEIELKIQQAPAFDIEGTFGIETATDTETSEGGRKLPKDRNTGEQRTRVKPVYLQTVEDVAQRLKKKIGRGDTSSTAIGGRFGPNYYQSQEDYTNYFYFQYQKQYLDNLDMDPNNPINKKKRKIKEAEDDYVVEQAERDGLQLEQGSTTYPYEVWKKYSDEFKKKLKPDDLKIYETSAPFKTTGLVAGPVLTQVQRLQQQQQKQKEIDRDLARRQKYYGEQVEFVDEKVVVPKKSVYAGSKARKARYTPEATERYRGEGGFGGRIIRNISDIGSQGNQQRQIAQKVFETERRKEVESKKYKILLQAGLSEAEAKIESQNISSVDYEAIDITSGEEGRLMSKIDSATKEYRKREAESKKIKKSKSKKESELFGKTESDYEKEFRRETKGLYEISADTFFERKTEFDKQKQDRADRRLQQLIVEQVESEEGEESEEAQAPLDVAVEDAFGDDFEVES